MITLRRLAILGSVRARGSSPFFTMSSTFLCQTNCSPRFVSLKRLSFSSYPNSWAVFSSGSQSSPYLALCERHEGFKVGRRRAERGCHNIRVGRFRDLFGKATSAFLLWGFHLLVSIPAKGRESKSSLSERFPQRAAVWRA